MSQKDRWLRRLVNRLHFGLFLKSFVDCAVFYCLALGVIILLSKLFWPQFWPNVLWLTAAAIPVTIAAFMVSRRYYFSRQHSVAILDGRIGAGGLLMTVMESPDQQWESLLPPTDRIWKNAIPAVRPVRLIKHLSAPLLFLVITCLVPPRAIQSLMITPSAVSSNQVAQLQDILKQLDENEILNEEEKDQLEEEIKKLAKETRFSPLTHEKWETVDALRQKMQTKISSRENQLNKAASAEAALRRSLENSGEAPGKQLQQLEEILESLRNGNGENQNNSERNGQNSLSGQLSKFAKNGKLKLPENPQELRDALNELRDFIDAECTKISNCQGGLCPGGWCEGEEFSMIDGEIDGAPGRGGITRGRGDATLTWGQESDDQGVMFRDLAIPQGLADPDGELLETKLTTPEANPQAPNARADARQVTDALGQQSWKRQLRPRHKDVVKKYFNGNTEK